MLEKRQVLAERKFCLSQEEARLDLEAEIAKSAAKRQALGGTVLPSGQPLTHPLNEESKCIIEEGGGPSAVW